MQAARCSHRRIARRTTRLRDTDGTCGEKRGKPRKPVFSRVPALPYASHRLHHDVIRGRCRCAARPRCDAASRVRRRLATTCRKPELRKKIRRAMRTRRSTGCGSASCAMRTDTKKPARGRLGIVCAGARGSAGLVLEHFGVIIRSEQCVELGGIAGLQHEHPALAVGVVPQHLAEGGVVVVAPAGRFLA